jgi:hypothetical protein
LAVAEHFNPVPVLTSAVRKYCDDRTFGVIAESLIDLVTNCEFRSHVEPSSPYAQNPHFDVILEKSSSKVCFHESAMRASGGGHAGKCG